MNKPQAIAEWQRAKVSMRAASLCLRYRCYADTISRAYYAVLHAARAALRYYYGEAGSGHKATNNLFGRHIVMTGMVEPRWGSEIGRLIDLRTSADYDVSASFSQTRVLTVCQRAARFLERILRLLTTSIPFEELT